MKRLCLIMSVLTCGLAGGCVESTFCLARGSPLPQGLRTDDEAQRAGRTASRVELWLYTNDPPTLKFFAGPNLILSRPGSDIQIAATDEFSVRFNGVRSTFRLIALPNVIAVEEGSHGTSLFNLIRAHSRALAENPSASATCGGIGPPVSGEPGIGLAAQAGLSVTLSAHAFEILSNPDLNRSLIQFRLLELRLGALVLGLLVG